MFRYFISIWIALGCGLANGASSDPTLSEIAELYCAGKFDEAVAVANEVPTTSPRYVLSRFMAVQSDFGLNQTLARMKSYEGPVNDLPEIDRLQFAYALWYSDSLEIDKIKHLLSFASQDPVVENYRRFQEGVVKSFEGDRAAAFDLSKNAFYSLPYEDWAILTEILRIAAGEKNGAKIAGPFYSYIEKVPKNSSDYFLLKAYKDFLETGDVAATESDLAQAYRLCKFDERVVLAYSATLMKLKKSETAKKILAEAKTYRKSYTPYLDLYLLFIAHEEKSLDQVSNQLPLVQRRRQYFSKYEQGQIHTIEEWIDDNKNYKWIGSLLLVLVMALGSYFLTKSFFQKDE